MTQPEEVYEISTEIYKDLNVGTFRFNSYMCLYATHGWVLRSKNPKLAKEWCVIQNIIKLNWCGASVYTFIRSCSILVEAI